MSKIVGKDVFIFHSDLGPVITEIESVQGYDVEDIIKRRAISQARACQFLNLGKQANPNDPKAARTIVSAYSSSKEELA